MCGMVAFSFAPLLGPLGCMAMTVVPKATVAEPFLKQTNSAKPGSLQEALDKARHNTHQSQPLFEYITNKIQITSE
jgi:hypothetical protein